jgi:Helix-turn-helix
VGKSSLHTRNNISSESQIVQTSGEIFADGSAIELIVPKSDGQPRLLFWDQRGKVIATNIKHLGRVYQALAPHFATELRVSQGQLSRYEQGRSEMGAEVLLRLARKSGKTIEWLLTGKDSV